MRGERYSLWGGISVLIGLMWLTVDRLHLGLLDWFDRAFGWEWGGVFWSFFWLLLLWGVWKLADAFIRRLI